MSTITAKRATSAYSPHGAAPSGDRRGRDRGAITAPTSSQHNLPPPEPDQPEQADNGDQHHQDHAHRRGDAVLEEEQTLLEDAQRQRHRRHPGPAVRETEDEIERR